MLLKKNVTYRAFKVLIAQMTSFMHNQIARVTKFSPTHVTSVWFFATVGLLNIINSLIKRIIF